MCKGTVKPAGIIHLGDKYHSGVYFLTLILAFGWTQ